MASAWACISALRPFLTTSRFDTKAFRAAYEFMYNDFCKPQTVQRFTVSAVA